MILSDFALSSLLSSDTTIGPASQDLSLGERLIRLPHGETIDPEQDQSGLWQDVERRYGGRWLVAPYQLYLGTTQEMVAVPNGLVAMLHGISSLGRSGLLVHCTAGLVDPGWSGRLTLEIVSLGGPILLRPGMRIAQLTWHQMTESALHPYRGKYQHDTGPRPSRMHAEVRP